jgi:protein-L-isoaspartate(D-aspartate) O-methyltransferase
MPEIDFLSVPHKGTERDYLAWVNELPKAEAAKVAKKFDAEAM